jgi:ferric-dicitrate binding protein FerR (iron transport regulator)
MNAGGTTPTPEKLAAYADGELHGADRAAVEAWLEACPQARAEVEALRHLAHQCRCTSAPEPSTDAWETVLNNICAALPSGSGPRRLVYAGRPRLAPVLGAVAAAVLAVVLMGQFLPWNRPAPPAAVANPGTLRQPLDLADAHEVDIISIGDDDSSNLLVGRVPVREVLLLAGPDDVTNVGAEPFQGVTPTLRHNGDASIIVPIAPKDAP